MTDSNTPATAMQEAVREAILKAYDAGYEDAHKDPETSNTYNAKRAVRLGSDELLSKLRAPVAETWTTGDDDLDMALNMAGVPVADERAAYTDPLSNFQEGQWWIKELDALAQTVGATHDQKRAVAVVHHMLRAARLASAPVAGEAVANMGGLPDWWSRFMNELTLRSEDEVRNDLPGILEICALDAIGNAAPQPSAVAGEAVGKIVLFGDDLKEVSWTAGKMPPPGTVLYAAPQASEAVPKLPQGWQLALNLAIDAIENAAPAGQDWPVNWPAILHGLTDLRAALSAQPGAQKNGGGDGDQ